VVSTRFEDLPVVVIGAGPVGLAAAAHLAERGIRFTVLEAGNGPVAATSAATARLLTEAGWVRPDDDVLGASGIPAHGETDAAPLLEHALPDVLGADRDRFAGKRVLVVGAGYSAANTLLLLADLADQAPGTEITWAIRATSPARTYGGETADRVVSATGFRPDHSIAAELRLDLDPIIGASRTLAPLIDTNDGGCCGTPVAESVTAGRGLATGVAGGLLSAPLTLLPVAAPGSDEQAGGCCS
jgi:hypothetical protein